jgi:hypothetical protein
MVGLFEYNKEKMTRRSTNPIPQQQDFLNTMEKTL